MKDEQFMRRALELASKSNPSPNPRVGCVIVRDGRIVGEGFHRRAGSHHAEVNALREAGRKARGATAYVTLEPCCFFGRTPPCTDAVISSGVKKVVVAMSDPNPRVNGRGVRLLRKSGLKVDVGLLEDDARMLNQAYIKHITQGMPYVILKSAMTLDGKIASKTGDSKWVSSEASRKLVHELRGNVDAVVVGVNTVLKDNPMLTSHRRGRRNPLKVVMDGRLRTPLDSKVVGVGTLVATSKRFDRQRRKALESRGVEVVVLDDGRGGVSFRKLLKFLGRRDVMSLLVEGGGELNWSALSSRGVDRVLLFIAPKIVGGRDAVTPVEGEGVGIMRKAFMIHDLSVTQIGEDVRINGLVCRY